MCRYYTVPPSKGTSRSVKPDPEDETNGPATLTSSLKESKCGSHQRTFRVDAVGKGWAASTPRTAPTGLCASLKSLQPSEMDKSLTGVNGRFQINRQELISQYPIVP